MLDNSYLIREQLKVILSKMSGGRIYGMPIDENDKDMLIVAAYFLGQTEEANLRNKHEDRLFEILDGHMGRNL